ncbi:MAG TPA: hypothetical protein VH559_11290 [Gemmatimonadaceae bacterium]|jgi:hypothetical protein
MATRISTHRIVAKILAIAAALSTHAAAQTTRPRELLLEARSELPAVTERAEHWGRTREIATWLAWARFYDDALATTRMDTMLVSLAYQDLARIRAANGDVAGATAMIDATLTGADAARAKSAVAAELAERGDLAQGRDVARGLTGRALHDVQLAAVARQITAGNLAQAESTIAVAAASGAFVDNARVDLAEAYFRRGNERDAQRIARQATNPDNPPDFAGIAVARAADRRSWDSAKVLIKTQDVDGVPNAFVVLARAMATSGDSASARKTLEEAIPLALLVKRPPMQLIALSKIAVAQYDLGFTASAAPRMVVPDLSTNRAAFRAFECEVTWSFAAARRYADALAINRTTGCRIASIAGYQFRAGDVDGAMRTMQADSNRANVVSTVAEWALFAAKQRDLPTATRLFTGLKVERSYDEGYLSPAVAEIAHLMAATGDAKAAEAWARARATPDLRIAALTAVARAMIEKQNPNAHTLCAVPVPGLQC